MSPHTPVSGGLYGTDEHERIRLFLLQAMNEAGLRVEHSVRDLRERLDPALWPAVEACVKAASITGGQTLLELLRAIHPGFVNLRRFDRVPAQARCLVAIAGRDRSGRGRITEVSRGGCRLECDLRLAPGTELTMDLLLPHEAGVVAIDRAVVRWARGRQAGVEFIHVRQEDRARLERYVERARSLP